MGATIKGLGLVVGCQFCEIIGASKLVRVVFEDSMTLAFLPISPATKGHTLVIPKSHVTDFLEADSNILATVAATAATVGRAVMNIVQAQGANLITSAGEAASQTVFHLHIHIVPRWRGDALGNIWPPKVGASDLLQDDLAADLRKACNRSL